MSGLLTAVDLSRRFGPHPAVEGLALSLIAGRITGLLGPDGAGKTTSMRLLVGLLRPDRGRVMLDGEDVTGRRAMRGRIGYMPQRFSLYPDLSVDENIRFYAGLFGVRGARRAERIDNLLGFARLEGFRRRRAEALSGGMKQKLALACTLIGGPEVLILDEPTTGVDPVSRVEFWEILGRLREEGTAILVSTPYMDEADRCDSVIVLKEGRILAEGTPAFLRAAFPLRVLTVRTSRQERAIQTLEGIAGVEQVVPFGDRLHVTLPASEPAVEEIARMLRSEGFERVEVVEADPTLEDVFIQLAESR